MNADFVPLPARRQLDSTEPRSRFTAIQRRRLILIAAGHSGEFVPHLLKALSSRLCGTRGRLFCSLESFRKLALLVLMKRLAPLGLMLSNGIVRSHLARADMELGLFDREPGFGSETGRRCPCSLAVRSALCLDIPQRSTRRPRHHG